MPVQLLSPQVAERIAAGEVIERPASVVKELVENSIDAGATQIWVSLSDGGKALIDVTDNGAGMSEQDLRLCVKRHATSKLTAVEDLESLSTLGFRGEALPSISAVAELTILTRSRESSLQDASTALLWRQDAVTRSTQGQFAGGSSGTQIQVRGLFSEIPARLKFLKSQASEVSQVREWIERLALAHPEIAFRLTSDGKTITQLREESEASRVQRILGDHSDFPVVSIDEERGFRVRAHWIQGLSSPQLRKMVQIVNGRAVKDRLLQQAILSPFRQALMPGQFPALALYLEIDPAQIDVNVHPTKTEIRFLNSREIFHSIESILSAMIEKRGAPAFVPGPQMTPWRAAEPLTLTSESATFTQVPLSPTQASHPFSASRYVGSLFQTYLLYDLGEELVLVDQHAAHERVRYEKLRKRFLSQSETQSSQALLIPEALKFPQEARGILESRLPALQRLGFETELFGEDSLLVRSIPSEWGADDLRPRLSNLLDRLLGGRGELLVDESLFEALASEACHSAIRAGDSLDDVEANSLVDSLFSCTHPWNCPHGRPTVVRMPRARFEEWFQRRV